MNTPISMAVKEYRQTRHIGLELIALRQRNKPIVKGSSKASPNLNTLMLQ